VRETLPDNRFIKVDVDDDVYVDVYIAMYGDATENPDPL
jgi:hypothetical protein